MLENLKVLLGITDNDSDALLNILIAEVQAFIIDYCNILAYDTSFDTITIKMVIELYNKRGSEGINSKSYSGVSENYQSDYSPAIYHQLNRRRRIKVM